MPRPYAQKIEKMIAEISLKINSKMQKSAGEGKKICIDIQLRKLMTTEKKKIETTKMTQERHRSAIDRPTEDEKKHKYIGGNRKYTY